MITPPQFRENHCMHPFTLQRVSTTHLPTPPETGWSHYRDVRNQTEPRPGERRGGERRGEEERGRERWEEKGGEGSKACLMGGGGGICEDRGNELC